MKITLIMLQNKPLPKASGQELRSRGKWALAKNILQASFSRTAIKVKHNWYLSHIFQV